MKKRHVLTVVLALLLCVTSGCGAKVKTLDGTKLLGKAAIEKVTREPLPEETAALMLVDVGESHGKYYLQCLPYDADGEVLSEEPYWRMLSDGLSASFYPMNRPGSGSESYYGADMLYSQYDEEQMKGILFWTFEFDEEGALCRLSDEVPRELIVEEHPVEDFYGCWDFSDSFWQPGLEMYNVPGEPPCGDYVVLYEDGTADIYRMEEQKVYTDNWEMLGSSAHVETLNFSLSFTEWGLEDSRGHYGDPGTPPSAEGLDWVDLT